MSVEVSGARIVVTGGAGLIGHPTAELLSRSGAEVVVFDLAGVRSYEMPGVVRVDGDLRDASAVRDAVAGADAVVHLGGIPGPDLVDDITTYEVNTVGTYSVFSAAASAGVKKVVYASSINATGLPIGKVRPPSRIPYGEDEPATISDSYSLSKRANEDAAEMASTRWGLELTGLRFPLVRDIADKQGKPFAEHVSQALQRDPLRQAYEGWSYLDAADAARAVLAALTTDTPPAPGILVAAPFTYLADATNDALDMVLPDVPRTPLVGREVGLDLSRARNLLGFEARLLLEDVGDGLLARVVR